mgnify:CR=1 FL=1
MALWEILQPVEAVIIDPHEILLLCVCVGSSILVPRLCEFSRTYVWVQSYVSVKIVMLIAIVPCLWWIYLNGAEDCYTL